jgi:hypothetical protein
MPITLLLDRFPEHNTGAQRDQLRSLNNFEGRSIKGRLGEVERKQSDAGHQKVLSDTAERG